MSNILIKNGAIVTMNQKREIIEKGDIFIEGNEITEIGEKIENDADIVINADKKAVIPGLINAHTHLSMVLFRGLADDLELQTWLEEKIWPMEAKLQSRHVLQGSLLGCLEMIKSGTTCFADLYFFMDQVAQAVERSGLRGSLAYGIIEPDDPEKKEEELEIGRELVENHEGSAGGRIRTRFGPHSAYTCSPDYLEKIRDLADEYGVGLHIHLAENEREVETVKEMHGLRPVELLDSINFLGPNILAAHCVRLEGEEFEMIRDNGVKPVHNPVSNMKLGSGIAPVQELLEEGVPVALGTDGAASNNSLDLFEEIKFAALLQKVHKEDATALPARQALEMATINGAKALGLEDQIGSIEEGKKADIVLIDLSKPNLAPLFNVESQIVYSCSAADVDTVIVDGEILMKEREVLTLEESTILKEAQEKAEELVEDTR